MAKVSIIPEDYDSLQKENKVLKSELENVNQELYGCKRQLKIFEALQNEYQSEIEILQSEHDIENQKLKEKIVHLEENLNETRIKYNEHIQSLEADLAKKEEENVSLQAKIELLKKVQLTQAPADDVNKLLEELASLKDEKDALLFNEEDLNLTVEILQKKNLKLEETLAEHREEVSNLKENLSCKREELFEANDLIQKLNNEMVYLKNELDLFKSKPLNEKSKGNSLFAEVDDRRVYLQKTINNMKTEYVCMKQERAKHLNMISHLRKENKTLCDRWKADTEEMEDDRDMVLKGHKDRIKILETLIENYKKDLSAKPLILSSGSFNEMEFYQSLLDRKTKEIEELRDQISARGLTQTILTTSLKEANREIRKWKLEATLKQCQIELNTSEKLSDSKMSDILDDVMENRSIKLEQVKKERNETRTGPSKSITTEIVAKPEPKDVITINDSSDDGECLAKDEDIKKSEDTDGKSVTQEKIKEEPVDTSFAGKENISENIGESKRKVTFSQNTTSPKVTDRKALKRNCRRIDVPKPIYIPSD